MEFKIHDTGIFLDFLFFNPNLHLNTASTGGREDTVCDTVLT